MSPALPLQNPSNPRRFTYARRCLDPQNLNEAAFNRIGWDAWELQFAASERRELPTPDGEPGRILSLFSTKSECQTVNADTPLRPQTDRPYRAIFLDRDGVINRPLIRASQPYAPSSLDEFEILPGVPKACQILKQLGFLLVVATNQPDVGRGRLPRGVVEDSHEGLAKQLPIDRVMTCFHGGTAYGDPCTCRKPLPGMLLQAAGELKISLAESFMIGDRWRDIDCGLNAGCKTIFIDWGYEEQLTRDPDFRARDLLDAAQFIVELERTPHPIN
jgi:D-glycero-D-manno-heptose 1,7-bisphosphate phosphatase